MIEHGVRISECLCCLKKCVAFVGNQRIIISLYTKLFSLKINVTDESMPCICLKCYYRLKLCSAYRMPFANLYQHIKKPAPLHTTNIIPRFNDVSIISHCPVCFIIRPSTKHIYEHLLNREFCKVCCTNVDNLVVHYAASPNCNQIENDAALVYYCSGNCGASFKRRKLRDLHENECEHAPKQVKIENDDSINALLSSSASNSPIRMDVSVVLQEDVLTDSENAIPNDNNSVAEQHQILWQNLEATETAIYQETAVSKRKSKTQCCPICSKWVTKIHRHMLSHDSSRQQPPSKISRKSPHKSPSKRKHESSRKIPLQDLPMIACRYCRMLLTESRVKRHETDFCPLRHNHDQTAESTSDVEHGMTVNELIPAESISLKSSSSKPRRKQCCSICGKWVNHLREHLMVHDPTRIKGPWPKGISKAHSQTPRNLPPKIECKYCHKLFMIGSRIKKHETEVCPLRYIDQTSDVKTETGIAPFVKADAAYPAIKPTVHTLNFYKQCCPICGKWVTKLSLHLFTHSSTPQFQCKYCHKFSKSKLSSRFHEKNCLKQPKYQTPGSVEKPFVCETCGKSFRLKRILQTHRGSHITFPCTICNATINKASESAHMKTQHVDEPSICAECGKVYKNQYALNSHYTRSHNPQAKTIACDVCGKKFLDKTTLSVHRVSHEVGEQKFSCKTCGMTFFTPLSVTEHVRRVHTKTKAYPCTVCGLNLSSAGTLKVHERQHTGVKPYSCDVCGKTFAQKPPLNRHLRSQHKIMPALTEKCPHCDKMFSSRMVLKSHMVKAH